MYMQQNLLQYGMALEFVPGPDAAYEDHGVRVLAVRGAQDLAAGGAGGVHQSLQLQAGDHIRQASVAVLSVGLGIGGLVSGGYHDRADLVGEYLFLHVVVYGARLAQPDALAALRADAAGEAPFGLFHGLLRRESQLHLGEAFDACIHGHLRHLQPGLFGILLFQLFDLFLAGLLGLCLWLGGCRQWFALQIIVDGGRGLAGGGHGINYHQRAGDGVAAGEDTLDVGRQAGLVDFDGALAGNSHIQILGEAQVGRLAQRRDDGIHVQLELGTGDGLGAGSSAGIRCAQLHLHAFDGLDLAALCDDLGGSGQEHDLNTFFFGGQYLHLVGRHLVPAAAVDDGHFAAQAAGRSGGVDGGVAAADDGDALADVHLLPQVDGSQEVNAVEDPLGFFAGHVRA